MKNLTKNPNRKQTGRDATGQGIYLASLIVVIHLFLALMVTEPRLAVAFLASLALLVLVVAPAAMVAPATLLALAIMRIFLTAQSDCYRNCDFVTF